jgi:hypothetical protein
MPRIIIKESGKPDKWVKNINKLTGEVTFTTNRSEAFVRDGGFYCKGEIKSLKNPMLYDHTKYPELMYAQIDGNGW